MGVSYLFAKASLFNLFIFVMGILYMFEIVYNITKRGFFLIISLTRLKIIRKN